MHDLPFILPRSNDVPWQKTTVRANHTPQVRAVWAKREDALDGETRKLEVVATARS